MCLCVFWFSLVLYLFDLWYSRTFSVISVLHSPVSLYFLVFMYFLVPPGPEFQTLWCILGLCLRTYWWSLVMCLCTLWLSHTLYYTLVPCLYSFCCFKETWLLVIWCHSVMCLWGCVSLGEARCDLFWLRLKSAKWDWFRLSEVGWG